MSRSLLALAALLALSGCAATRPPRAEVVEAEGWAPLGADGEPGARRRAVAEAQRRAVEQISGVTVRSRTTVAQAVSVDQRITAESLARIERYEIVSESHDASFFKVRLKAWVSRRPPQAPAPQGLRASADNARLAGPLSRRGWVIVGASDAPEVSLSATTGGAAVSDPLIRPMESWRARVTLEAKDTAGAVIWSNEQNAASLGVSSDEARREAESRAFDLAAAAASKELPEILWQRPH